MQKKPASITEIYSNNYKLCLSKAVPVLLEPRLVEHLHGPWCGRHLTLEHGVACTHLSARTWGAQVSGGNAGVMQHALK